MYRIVNRAPNGFLLAVAPFLFLFSHAALAQVGDDWLCRNSMPDDGIKACTRQIESGKLQGRALAVAYMVRGVMYRDLSGFEQFDAPKEKLEEYNRHEKSDYDTAIKIDPTYEPIFYNRGLYYYENEEYDLALADFSESIRLGPKERNMRRQSDFSNRDAEQQTGDSFCGRGRTYFKKSDFDHAIADYTKCLEFDPKKAQAMFDRALAYKAKGDTAHADADFDRAIKLDPKLKRPD